MNNSRSIYSIAILDHYHKPRHKKVLEDPHFVAALQHESCGDSIVWYGCIENEYLKQGSFQGSGCIISQAAASMLADIIQGKSLNDIRQLTANDIIAVLGIELGPIRLRCAVLPLEALLKGLNSYA